MASLLRTGASRALVRSLTSAQPKTTTAAAFRTQLHTLSRRPQIAAPKTLALTRWQSGREPVDSINKEREERLTHKTLKAVPDQVSASSTVLPTVGAENPRSGVTEAEQEVRMMSGINSDLVGLDAWCSMAW